MIAVTRVKLLLLLPLTVAVLVAAGGYFTMRMTGRVYLDALAPLPSASARPRLSADSGTAPIAPAREGADLAAIRRGLAGVAVQLALITAIAAALGFALALGVTAPLRPAARRLDATALGDRQGALDVGSTAAGVAHELRNPLASLQGLVELLGLDVAANDPKRRYITTMLDAIERLNGLVEDLLQLSSPGAPTLEPVNLNDLSRETVMFVRLGLGDKAVDLRSIEGPMPAMVLGSASRLGQALTNVVLNAVQATPAGGAITVETSAGERKATWCVHNTGSVIPPEQVKQLFVPFFTTKSRGTGLGLAIARQIVTAHGGRIDVESDERTGTTFVIELPLARAGAPEAVVSRW